MAWEECKVRLEAIAGRPLTTDAVEALVDAAEIKINEKLRRGMSRREALAEAKKDLAGEALLRSLIARRSAYINHLRKEAWFAQVAEGQESRAPRASIERAEVDYHGTRDQSFYGPVMAKLDEAGILEVVRGKDRAMDLDIARELYRRLDPLAAPATGNSRAVAAAKIFGDMQDVARSMLNKAGAWVAQIDNYITRQSHDMMKIRGTAFDDWATVFRAEATKTLEDMEPDEQAKYLKELYDRLASGVHDGTGNPVMASFGGPGSLAKKVSQSRSIEFNDADSWFRYNERFGKGGVMDAAMAGFDRAARDIALLNEFGTNPQYNYNVWLAELRSKAKGTPEQTDRIGSTFDQRMFDTVSGMAQVPGRETVAHIWSTFREIQQMAKLGRVVLAAISDVPIATSVLRHNGINIFTAWGNQLSALMPNTVEGRQIGYLLGAGYDGMLGSVINRFRAGDDFSGKMAGAVNTFHKLNGLAYWTDHEKSGVARILSANLAAKASLDFVSLPRMMRETLGRYGISEPEWNIARATPSRAADGRDYILPAEMADPAISRKFQAYIVDQTREALTEPTAWARTAATFGTRPGTWDGELVRTVMQFKTFGLTFMQRTTAREDLPGWAYLAVTMTAAGFAINAIKDILSGRTPANPTDPEHFTAVLRDAMIQGGAMGLMGDYVVRDAGFNGVNLARNLLGPGLGTAVGAVSSIQSIAEGSTRRNRGEIAASEALDTVRANTPFANLFYLKSAMDYLFVYRLQEAVNPGYVQRYEKRVRDQGKDFYWLKPSEATR